MAITSIWGIKGSSNGVLNYIVNPAKTVKENAEALTNLHSIDNLILYTTDEIKTEKCLYVVGINCEPETAVENFKNTKRNWKKTGGIVAFHAIQSFAEGEVDPKTANDIGVELANKLWGDRFEVVVATHSNTNHIHNHFCINSVSIMDGYKYNDCKETYRRMREESDRLCKEYGLSVIEHPNEKGKNYGEWLAEKEGRPTLRGSIREAIDIAIKGSTTEGEFLDAMDEMGYVINQSGKYAKIKHVGSDRFVRFKSLGEGYSIEEILDRVHQNAYPEYPNLPRQDSPQNVFEDEYGRVASFGYIAVYRCYYNALRISKQRPNENRSLYLLVHQDHNKMRTFSDGVQLLSEHHLNSQDEILAYKREAINKVPEIEKLRNEMRNALKRAKRANDLAEISKINYNIDIYTRQLNKLRREIKSCDYVIERAEEVKSKLQMIEDEKFTGKDGRNYEHISRSGRSSRANES